MITTSKPSSLIIRPVLAGVSEEKAKIGYYLFEIVLSFQSQYLVHILYGLIIK